MGTTQRWTGGLFWLAAVYDAALGAAFLLAGPTLYRALGIAEPSHWGPTHFAAALLLVFGWMFSRIARDPEREQGLILYGLLLKVAYVGVVLRHAVAGDVPVPFAVFAWIDAAMAVAFLAAWRTLAATASRTGTGNGPMAAGMDGPRAR